MVLFFCLPTWKTVIRQLIYGGRLGGCSEPQEMFLIEGSLVDYFHVVYGVSIAD